MSEVTAVDIKAFRFLDPATFKTTIGSKTDIDSTLFASLWKAAADTAITNMHQETWTYEEAEASQDFYTNQLTGKKYRAGVKQMGDITVNFTIGPYDYKTKANVLGGTVIEEGTDGNKKAVGWKRADGVVDIYKTVMALTRDNQYILLPYVSIAAREANTDKAVGLAVKGTVIEAQVSGVSSEYWFDGNEIAVDVA
jgi:hypothetical protein